VRAKRKERHTLYRQPFLLSFTLPSVFLPSFFLLPPSHDEGGVFPCLCLQEAGRQEITEYDTFLLCLTPGGEDFHSMPEAIRGQEGSVVQAAAAWQVVGAKSRGGSTASQKNTIPGGCPHLSRE